MRSITNCANSTICIVNKMQLLVLSRCFFTIFSSMRDRKSKILCKDHNVDMTETNHDKRRLESTKVLKQNKHNEQKSNSIRTCSLNNNNKQTHDQKRNTITNLGAGTNKRKNYPINSRLCVSRYSVIS